MSRTDAQTLMDGRENALCDSIKPLNNGCSLLQMVGESKHCHVDLCSGLVLFICCGFLEVGASVSVIS